jgi:threonine synthase
MTLFYSNQLVQSLTPVQALRSSALIGLRCLRCARQFDFAVRHEGCLACRAHGHFVSLAADYVGPSPPSGIHLPYLSGFSLGEGQTPYVDLADLADEAGVAQLMFKDESRNPTGSHKDRLSAYGVRAALDFGRQTLILSSSGNAAISAARYAQAAGLKCEVAVFDRIGRGYLQLLEQYGAQCHRFQDNAQRWQFVHAQSLKSSYLALTNFSIPAVGSFPLGVEAYKAIALESVEANKLPTDVIVPTARGDLAWGIFSGYQDLLASGRIAQMPKIWIVEPFPRLSAVLAGGALHQHYAGHSEQFSVTGDTVTYLQWQAATASGGGAIVIADPLAKRARQRLNQIGISAELCAAAGLAAVFELKKSSNLTVDSRVHCVLTASSKLDPSVEQST